MLGAMLLSRDRDRRGHGDPRRVRLLPRVARDDLPRLPRALGEGRAGRRDHARERARGARRARAGRRQRARRRARGARPGDGERRALRADRQGDGDAARADPARARRSRGSARSGSGETTELVDRAEQIVFDLSQQRVTRRLRPHRAAAHRELRADHEALRGGCRRHRRPVRVPRPRPAHVGLPAGQPRDPRRAAVDGEVRARALHRREPRRPHARRRSRCSRSRCRRPRSRSA